MRILFFNPANYLEIGIPQGIAILSALLKNQGHAVELFDTTFLKPPGYRPGHDELMAGPTIYKKTAYTLEDLVAGNPEVDITSEFQRRIDDFRPDLLAVSAMTTNYEFAVETLGSVKANCPVIIGGVHPTICPDEVIGNEKIDMLCLGEGEEALLELCHKLERGVDIRYIRNLWVKHNGRIYKNQPRPFVNLDTLPTPDWSLFDRRHLFRPFLGEIYNGGFYISSRGCPAACTYCVNLTLRKIFRGCGRYFRYQNPDTTIAQLSELKGKYDATWFKFGDDTFLLQPLDNLRELAKRMKPLKIQFGCSVRPDTVTKEKVDLVKEMGCVAMSVGIETGNEKMRRNVLNRQISDRQIEEAFKIINDAGIRLSTFNLIGLPNEKRENIFETIRFNKKLNVKSANVYILYPFPGTRIYSENGISCRNTEGRIIPMEDAAVFNLSNLGINHIKGMEKAFNLYLSLPEQLWPIVKLAEKLTPQGEKIYRALSDYATTIV